MEEEKTEGVGGWGTEVDQWYWKKLPRQLRWLGWPGWLRQRLLLLLPLTGWRDARPGSASLSGRPGGQTATQAGPVRDVVPRLPYLPVVAVGPP